MPYTMKEKDFLGIMRERKELTFVLKGSREIRGGPTRGDYGGGKGFFSPEGEALNLPPGPKGRKDGFKEQKKSPKKKSLRVEGEKYRGPRCVFWGGSQVGERCQS